MWIKIIRNQISLKTLSKLIKPPAARLRCLVLTKVHIKRCCWYGLKNGLKRTIIHEAAAWRARDQTKNSCCTTLVSQLSEASSCYEIKKHFLQKVFLDLVKVGLTCLGEKKWRQQVDLLISVSRRSDVVNLEDHLDQLGGQQDLRLLAVQRLDDVLLAHVWKKRIRD